MSRPTQRLKTFVYFIARIKHTMHLINAILNWYKSYTILMRSYNSTKSEGKFRELKLDILKRLGTNFC